MFISRLFIPRIFRALLNSNIQFDIGLQEVCSMCQATAIRRLHAYILFVLLYV